MGVTLENIGILIIGKKTRSHGLNSTSKVSNKYLKHTSIGSRSEPCVCQSPTQPYLRLHITICIVSYCSPFASFLIDNNLC